MLRKILFVLFLFLIVDGVFSQGIKADFTANSTKLCKGFTISFSNLSTTNSSKIISSNWDFGDGNPQNLSGNVGTTHIFEKPGRYTITLVIILANGLTESTSRENYIEVFEKPVASFNFSGNLCQTPTNIQVENTSIHTPGSEYQWNFGNGEIVNARNPLAITYKDMGNYAIKLTIKSSFPGCVSEASKSFKLFDFKMSIKQKSISDSICYGDSVSFEGKGSMNVDRYEWYFSGNKSSKNSSLVYNPYFYSWDYRTSLVGYNNQTGCSHTAHHDFRVKIKVQQPPIVSFSDTLICLGTPLKIVNSTKNGSNYEWSFGDTTTFKGKDPQSHTYQSAGKYSIGVNFTGVNGCKSSKIFKDAIDISLLKAKIEASKSKICPGESIQFTNLSNTSAQFNWNFGDGKTASGLNPLHTYDSLGVYPVSVTFSETNGCKGVGVLEKPIVVQNPEPLFSVNTTKICPGASVFFANDTPSGSEFVWNFGDGSSYKGKTPPAHSYVSPGKYSVSLSYKEVNGCRGYKTQKELVLVAYPTASFTLDSTNGCAPLPVHFQDSSFSYDPSSDPIVEWNWTFGNGASFKGKIPPVQYFNAGVFGASLSVKTKKGCAANKQKNNSIKVGKIDSVIIIPSTTKSCYKQEVEFQNKSIIKSPHNLDELSYEWVFNNALKGEKTKLSVFKKVFDLDTGYQRLKATVDFRGCKGVMDAGQIVLVQGPISKFSVAQNVYCNPTVFPVNVSFLDSAKHGRVGENINVKWEFYDGSSQTISNVDLTRPEKASVQHDYTKYGDYEVTQVVTNETTGCQDASKKIFYISMIDANYIPDNDSVCQYSPLLFRDKSVSYHPVQNWTYSFTDGGLSSGNPASYSFSKAGVFDSKVIAKNQVGCIDSSFFSKITVLPLPISVISSDSLAGCKPLKVHFFNLSQQAENGMPIQQYVWNSNLDNVQKVTSDKSFVLEKNFTREGDFTTSLTTIDVFGCRSSASVGTSITKPQPEFILNDTICNRSVLRAMNLSKGVAPLNFYWSMDENLISTSTDLNYLFDDYKKNITNTHEIKLVAVDGNRCKNEKKFNVTIVRPRPFYTVSYSSQLQNNLNKDGEYKCPPIECTFINRTKSMSEIDSTYWLFGIGRQSFRDTAKVFYAFPGNYTVRLKTVDKMGCISDTIVKDFMTILGPKAVPEWLLKDVVCGNKFEFTTKQEANVKSFKWNFGDKNFEDKQATVVHSYANISTYYPTLIVVDFDGCKVEYALDSIVVQPKNQIEANFEVTPKNIDIGEEVLIKDQSLSSGPIVSWKWEFGNGKTELLNYPKNDSVRYVTSGYKNILVTITTAEGCQDQFEQRIEVSDVLRIPNVFTPNNDNINEVLGFKDVIFLKYDLIVYNRWGNVVIYKKDATDKVLWDGKTQSGEVCTQGVYLYSLKAQFEDGTPFETKGFITLILD